MYIYSNLPKAKYRTKQAARDVIVSTYPDYTIEGIVAEGGNWVAKMAKADGPNRRRAADDKFPGNLPDKKKDDSGDEDDDIKPEIPGDKEESDEEGDDESKEKDEDGEGKEKSKSKKSPSADLVKRVQSLVSDIQKQLDDLSSAAQELSGKHDEKAKKLDSIKDLATDGDIFGGKPGTGGEETPDEIGPTPGGPPTEGLDEGGDLGAPPAGPKPPLVPQGQDKRRKPAVGVPAFSSRQKIVEYPLFRDNGFRNSLGDATSKIEASPKYAAYEVTGIHIDEDEKRIITHLTLRD